MYLHKVESTYGRLVPKPAKPVNFDEFLIDEKVPIQDQIESLRAKIGLKERNNRVLLDELSESASGSKALLAELYDETRELRRLLVEALHSERKAVYTALRTHRRFQLAMSERTVTMAMPWLEDKHFDIKKQLNALLDCLVHKRQKLEDAELMVMMIEKWPRPGTLPWELNALENFLRLENAIETMKVKNESAAILNAKYYDIKFILREERGKYNPIIRGLDNQLGVLNKEAKDLQVMLDDAVYFRDETAKNLILTEKEASANRRTRRMQMAKMKAAADRILAENALHQQPAHPLVPKPTYTFHKGETEAASENTQLQETMKSLQNLINRYQERARRFVDAMRVPNLIHIPDRIIQCRALRARLDLEVAAKELLRDQLLIQKHSLQLIRARFMFTGAKRAEEHRQAMTEAQAVLDTILHDTSEGLKRLNRYGDICIHLRLGVLGITSVADGGKRVGPPFAASFGLLSQMKILFARIKKFQKQVDEYEKMFEGKEPERSYGSFVKPIPIPARHIRVGSPGEEEEGSEAEIDEDILSSKVPNNLEIKIRSQRFIQQAILRRGLR